MYKPDKMMLPIYPHPPLDIPNEPVNTTIYIIVNKSIRFQNRDNHKYCRPNLIFSSVPQLNISQKCVLIQKKNIYIEENNFRTCINTLI